MILGNSWNLNKEYYDNFAWWYHPGFFFNRCENFNEKSKFTYSFQNLKNRILWTFVRFSTASRIFLFFFLDGTKFTLDIYSISRTLCPISNRLYASSYNGERIRRLIHSRFECHSTQSYLTSSKCACYALYIPWVWIFDSSKCTYAFKGDIILDFSTEKPVSYKKYS